MFDNKDHPAGHFAEEAKAMMKKEPHLRQLWLAGGCFWGMEAYFSRIPGVIYSGVGYANGRTAAPSYEDIHDSGHAETVHLIYDPAILPLQTLLSYFLDIIDPTSLNKQGNDIGAQYRSGIYYNDQADLETISFVLSEAQKKYPRPLMIEVGPLENYYPAEEYHQKYLEKNPHGYCHIDLSRLPAKKEAKEAARYQKPAAEAIKKLLTPLQYRVTQGNDTEPPFRNEFWNHHQKGIYVDIVTGEPLFVSGDKFDSGCGWPSFSRPLNQESLREKPDTSLGRARTEVRSSIGDSHLGHVFNDGPPELGGLRYCINSAALRFIPYQEMAAAGYGEYLPLIKD